MIDALAALRWLGIIAWLAVLFRLSPVALRALRLRVQYLDPLWAMIWMLVLNRIAYQASGVAFAPVPLTSAEYAIRCGLQLWSIALAAGVLWTFQQYEARHG